VVDRNLAEPCIYFCDLMLSNEVSHLRRLTSFHISHGSPFGKDGVNHWPCIKKKAKRIEVEEK
jgi:hypothetical protein